MRAKLYREHKYVSYALNELERLVAKTDFTEDEELKRVQDEWHPVKEMLKGHAEHEEKNFHPLLEKKGSHVHKHAHDDHDHQDHALEHLQELLDGIKSNPDRVEAGYAFYLAYRKFVGDNLLHLHEEETKILPELQRLYTDAELRAIEHPTYEIMSSTEILEMVVVLFPHMNLSDKYAFLKEIQLAQPKKFAEIWEKASQYLLSKEIDKLKDSF